ncbi:hypothetical protein AAG570_009944 [Ranatra chinensis]|uniref:Chitin-binding type-2 domain-containing protein n=1 Tax=Ranatra chinensis TaxID=642074 RepID=A0ABD0YQK0_9HEMI
MIRSVLLFAGLACLAMAFYDIDEPIYNRGDSIFLKSAELKADPSCPSQLYSCATCSATRICVPLPNGTWHHVQDVPCADPTPYCQKSTGSCSAEPDIDCGQKDGFICTRDGYFPDVKDCSVYHVCTNFVANSFQCINKTYDAIAQDCVKSTESCSPFDCEAKSGRKVPHSRYDTFFAYCRSDVAALVDRCDQAYVLNGTSQLCQPPCKANGPVADNTDCHKYFTCSMVYYTKDIVIPQLASHACPPGMGFDPVHLICTNVAADVPNCKF